MRRADELPTSALPRPAGATALRALLGAVLVWAGATGLAHHGRWSRTWRAADLGTLGTVLATALPVVALLAAVLLASRRSAFVGAVAGAAVACVALFTTVVTWTHGVPVACTCVDSAVRDGTRANVEAVIGDALLLALACATAWATRAVASDGRPPPAS